MKNPFKRKRCKECGEPLRIFDKTDHCDIVCYTSYKTIEKEYEESVCPMGYMDINKYVKTVETNREGLFLMLENGVCIRLSDEISKYNLLKEVEKMEQKKMN